MYKTVAEAEAALATLTAIFPSRASVKLVATFLTTGVGELNGKSQLCPLSLLRPLTHSGPVASQTCCRTSLR